jgi:hypothetical protein
MEMNFFGALTGHKMTGHKNYCRHYRRTENKEYRYTGKIFYQINDI